MTEPAKERWGSGEPYDLYVGRWSRIIAREFLAWLNVPPGEIWGDVGCGTGALVESILATQEPESILAIDRSEGFAAAARRRVSDRHLGLAVADAAALPWTTGICGAAVSGLVLNFVPVPAAMLSEMVRATKPDGRVAVYVWDYSGGMEMMRYFWDAAVTIRPNDASLDQAERFPICQPEPLRTLFGEAGLRKVAVRAIDIPTVFRDFDDYWTPFLGKQGAAPTYLASLEAETREQIRQTLKARLIPSADGSIHLSARAWAVQGIV